MAKNTFTTEEVAERISKACQEMTGEELADFYNEHFGNGMTYVGDSTFEQEEGADEDDARS